MAFSALSLCAFASDEPNYIITNPYANVMALAQGVGSVRWVLDESVALSDRPALVFAYQPYDANVRSPYTIPVVLILGFWLPCTLALQIIYPALDKAFHLEKTITARREDEINDLMEQHEHTSV